MFNFFNGSKKITEKLYEQNLELAIKNKTLFLLGKLYETSTLTLTPEEMAQAIVGIIQKDLNLESAGILRFEKKNDTLTPLAFSYSNRYAQTLHTMGLSLNERTISHVSQNKFLFTALNNKTENITQDLSNVFVTTKENLETIKNNTHLRTTLVYPITIGKEVWGVLLLGFNRNYDKFSTFEKESMKAFINPIGLLLYKAYLYKSVQKAYAVEKKAKEELERLDTFKDQFLMTTQHNLRTPLTSMMGYTDLILSGNFGKQNKKTTEVVKKFQVLVDGMIKMVNDFLDMAQFQLGRDVVSLKPNIDIGPILNEIVQELAFKAESKGVYVKLQKPKEVLSINADRQKLKAAIFNIIDNAVKYTTEGGVSITVKRDNNLTIVIADTGIGIAKEKTQTIFDQMFVRSEEAKKVSSLGSGVGLYLSNQIIKSHHGRIWVESEGQGKGSTFYIELPRQ